MKITKVETFKAWVDWCNWLLVRITTDEGIVGWGEGTIHGPIEPVESAIRSYADYLIGKDPAGAEQHWHRLYNAWRWRGGAVYMTAISAIDIALWDIEGKRLGVPVYRLLGGAHRTRLRVYASHWLREANTPEEVTRDVSEVVRRGFTGFKCSVLNFDRLRENESGEIRRAETTIAAARAASGPDVDIFVECSELLSERTAIMLDEALSPHRVAWFEEPIPYENAKVMGRLQRRLRTPIACGERLLSRYEFRELIERGACRIVQPDIMHAGGFTELRRIAALADSYYVPVAPHNPAGPVGTAAAMQLCAAIPNFFILEQMEPQRATRDRASINPPRFEDGHFVLPDTPGIGVEPNLDVLKELQYRMPPYVNRPGSLWR